MRSSKRAMPFSAALEQPGCEIDAHERVERERLAQVRVLRDRPAVGVDVVADRIEQLDRWRNSVP